MKTVSIKNEYISKLDSLEIGIVLSLNYLATSNTEIMFNNSFIQYLLYGEGFNSDQRTDKTITDAIQSLIENGIIEPICTIGKGKNCNYVISNENIYIDGSDGVYTWLEFKWVQKVASNNIDTLKVLIAIVSSFNNETRVGYNSQTNYCENYNIAERTFIRHLQALEEMGVLYVKRNGTYNFDGDIKSLNNDYGFIDNIQNVNSVASSYVNGVLGANGMEVNNNTNKVDGRKIKARYNAFMNGSTKWDIEELKADCIRYNEYYSKFGGNTKYLDLSVFDAEQTIVEDLTSSPNGEKVVEDTRDSVDRAIDEINDFFGNDTEDNEDLCVGGTYDDYCNDTVTDVQDKDSSFIDAFNEFNDTLQDKENERKKKVYDSMMNTFMRIISNEDVDAWVEEELKDVIVQVKNYKSVSLSMIATAEMKFNKLLKEYDLVA